jgi:hypothetical protein
MTDFAKIPEIRPISGHAFFSLSLFILKTCGKGTKTTSICLEKILNHFLRTFEVPGGFFVKNINYLQNDHIM